MILKIRNIVILIFVLIASIQLSFAANNFASFANDTVFEVKMYQITDSIIQDLTSEEPTDTTQLLDFKSLNPYFWKKANKFTIEPLDYLTLESNPLFKPLVLKKPELKNIWDASAELQKAIYANTEESKIQKYLAPFSYPEPYALLKETRAEIERRIRLSKPELFAYQIEKLPNAADLKNNVISTRPLNEIALRENTTIGNGNKKLTVQKIVASPWTKRASVLAQFSQNMVTNNWYLLNKQSISIRWI